MGLRSASPKRNEIYLSFVIVEKMRDVVEIPSGEQGSGQTTVCLSSWSGAGALEMANDFELRPLITCAMYGSKGPRRREQYSVDRESEVSIRERNASSLRYSEVH